MVTTLSSHDRIIGEVQDAGDSAWLGYEADNVIGRIGESGTSPNRMAEVPIIGFALPHLVSAPVYAQIRVTQMVTGGGGSADVDLYGFEAGVDPTNTGTNYYYSSSTADTDGVTRLQSAFLPYNAATGTVQTVDITDYIRTLYTASAPRQQEVFFRLNLNDAIGWGSSQDRIEFDSASVELILVATNHYKISTAHGTGADVYVEKNTDTEGVVTSTGRNNTLLRARFNASTRNENIILRFDLGDMQSDMAAITPTQIAHGAGLFLMVKDDKDINPTFNVYGLKDSAPGQDWDEGTIEFATAPMFNFDENSPATRDRDDSVLTFLGRFSPDLRTAGDIVAFSSQALADFINADTDGLVTLLVEREDVRGTWYEFYSKEGSVTAPYLCVYRGGFKPTVFRFH